MLTAETKRNIDAARDVLVGKVPDPKAQVEQITTALIYKFMDDLDREAAELGGQAQFFTGEYERYAWSNLLDTRLSGEGRLDLYVQAIKSMERNPSLPQLFRDIFKGAFLPYNDPQTLALFLKEINKFTYEHSEELGNAFEYLLSVLGSQGDAGQFRTPRHIIDFMVAAVDPQKHETILDPACGTAGFLISAYKHIRRHNSSGYRLDANGRAAAPGESAPALTLADKAVYDGDQLTPEERLLLAQNMQGYDISPDMVRLSLVNLYLHGFASPRVYEYDTLTSEERWDDTFDVILANPPFMSPKGGIRPHKRFQVQAKRSEVLFVDYILEHLNLNGRAAVIVPEGIIFKSENAYKALRRLLLDDGLLAVVSLPPGVFNPYAGVKTCILFFNNQVARRVPDQLFLKVEQDGFDLGAQRRKIESDDLPEALRVLRAWMGGEKRESPLALWVDKARLAADGDYNLSGERYRDVVVRPQQKWPLVKLGEIVELYRGVTYSKNDEVIRDGYKILRANNISLDGSLNFEDIKTISKNCPIRKDQLLIKNDIFICLASGSKEHIGKVAYIEKDLDFHFGGFMGAIRIKDPKVMPRFIFHILHNNKFNDYLRQSISGANINNLSGKILYDFQIPLPPLDVQRDIVEQIHVKQAAIDAAKAVIANLEKERRFFGRELASMEGVEWVPLGEVCEVNPESEIPVSRYGRGFFTYLDISSINNGHVDFNNVIDVNKAPSRARRVVQNNDVIISTVRPNLRSFALLENIPEKTITSTGFAVLRAKDRINPKYLHFIVNVDLVVDQMVSRMGKGSYPSINQNDVKELMVPVLPLKKQIEMVMMFAQENEIIQSTQMLIKIMEKKIEQVLENI